MTDYKSEKEAFVSHITGSSVTHVNLVSSIALVSIEPTFSKKVRLNTALPGIYCIALSDSLESGVTLKFWNRMVSPSSPTALVHDFVRGATPRTCRVFAGPDSHNLSLSLEKEEIEPKVTSRRCPPTPFSISCYRHPFTDKGCFCSFRT